LIVVKAIYFGELFMSDSTNSIACPGQICWLPTKGSDQKILHWRSRPFDPWKPYYVHPLKQPDLTIPGASLGMVTAQLLSREGWQYVSAENVASEKPIAGRHYQHYKGSIYEVWAIGRTEQDVEFAIYAKIGSPFKFQSVREYIVSDTEDLQHYSVDIFTAIMVAILVGHQEAIAWASPLDKWMKPVEVEGKMRDRFSLINS